MNELIIIAALVIIVVNIAKAVNYFFPPDYHQRIEENKKE